VRYSTWSSAYLTAFPLGFRPVVYAGIACAGIAYHLDMLTGELARSL
jgi:hypothetical protein